MVYGMAWRGYGMMYSMAWGHGMAWYVEILICFSSFYDIALGYGPVHMWRSRCQLKVLFTSTGPIHEQRDRYMHVPFTCTAPVPSGQ